MIEPLLPWQTAAWKRLLKTTEQGRLPHAWLLAASPGSGLRRFAEHMARHLLCETAKPGGCGACASCQLLAAGHHPDLIELAPAEDKRQIEVESLREAMTRLALASHRGGRRLLLIDPAESLNEHGANALLKTLEEPAAKAHLILLTQRLHSLKATVRSRCQIVQVGRPSVTQGWTWLRENHPQMDETVADYFTSTPLDAVAVSEDGDWDPPRWSELLHGPTKALARIAALQKHQYLPVLRWMIQETAFVLRDRFTGVYRPLPVWSQTDPRILSDWLESLRAAQRQLAGGANPNPRLLLESLMIDLYAKTSTRA